MTRAISILANQSLIPLIRPFLCDDHELARALGASYTLHCRHAVWLYDTRLLYEAHCEEEVRIRWEQIEERDFRRECARANFEELRYAAGWSDSD